MGRGLKTIFVFVFFVSDWKIVFLILYRELFVTNQGALKICLFRAGFFSHGIATEKSHSGELLDMWPYGHMEIVWLNIFLLLNLFIIPNKNHKYIILRYDYILLPFLNFVIILKPKFSYKVSKFACRMSIFPRSYREPFQSPFRRQLLFIEKISHFCTEEHFWYFLTYKKQYSG